jgi:hypothetical protein
VACSQIREKLRHGMGLRAVCTEELRDLHVSGAPTSVKGAMKKFEWFEERDQQERENARGIRLFVTDTVDGAHGEFHRILRQSARLIREYVPAKASMRPNAAGTQKSRREKKATERSQRDIGKKRERD